MKGALVPMCTKSLLLLVGLIKFTFMFSTSSMPVYKARTWIKVNFDHLFLLTNYELNVIKIISLETSFEYESNDMIFTIYISFFLLTKIGC
jgi:hypothetical protein